jgi:hypothetical protein
MTNFCRLGIGSFVLVVVAFVLVGQTPSHSAPRTGALHDCYRKQLSNKKDVVECGEGDVVVGGGGGCYGYGGNWHSFLTASEPSGNGWKLKCENLDKGGEQVYGNAYAICCKQ